MEHLFLPKFITTLKEGYTRHQFTKDIMAGTIVGIVALPLAIAFAIASGVGPEKGLVTAIVAGILISLLGGSRVQIGGPTGAFVVIVAGIIANYGIDGLIISTIMAGLIMIVFGLLRLGVIIRFIPYPLTVGFTSGIAVLIFVSQIKDFFGLQTGPMPADFAGKINMLIVSFDTINPVALGIGVMSVLVTLFWSRITARVPGSLIALLIGVVLVIVFGVNAETIGSRFGEIPSRLPLPSFPDVSMDLIIKHIGPAFTIAMLGSIESLLSAVVSDSMIGGRHRSNTELIAQGIANVGSGLFGGIPATGAIARTATNVKNGGRTPVAGIVHALVLLIIMLFAGKWAALIPLSVLAGILMVVAYNMSEWRSFVTILRGSRYDVLVLLTSFILTVVVDLTIAIQVGMVLAALLFMKRMADVAEVKPLVSYASGDKDDTGMVGLELPRNTDVFEISGPMFFGVANKFKELMHEIADDSDIIIIRMRNVPMIDATGIHNFNAMLGHFIHKRKRVLLSGVNETVLSELRRHGIVALVGKENIFSHFEEALAKAQRVSKR
ncbi:SulP family inorganic anion transporter [Alkaliflexus imshenetskii]|uniref:SulP family inorganic anion transporter n=1 Tax=Alkaliflexus imshenetskii TaxID=286730 RepID=UPI00047DA20B|nr:SulP family inorganic anion transporter [Alkaliflexus imshenetskii]